MDKWTYRRAMPFLCTVTALLIGTLSLTAKMNQVFFFIWVCLIYLCIGGFYAMFPAYTSISFGNLYMTANYGWIFTNQFISSFVSAFFVNAFIGTLGNTGVTVCLAARRRLSLWLRQEVGLPRGQTRAPEDHGLRHAPRDRHSAARGGCRRGCKEE